MASYCLPQAKAWHSLEKQREKYGTEPEVLGHSSSTVGQFVFHVCEHGSFLVKKSGV
jgi:hypothetical protein